MENTKNDTQAVRKSHKKTHTTDTEKTEHTAGSQKNIENTQQWHRNHIQNTFKSHTTRSS